MAVSTWSTTSSLNVVSGGVSGSGGANIAEGCPPSGINDAIRDIMAQIKTFLSDSNFTLISTDAGATAAPVLNLYRNSASPAASDIIGKLLFQGEDSAGNTEDYSEIYTTILDPTSTSEDANILLRAKVAGTMTTLVTVASTGVTLGANLLLATGGVINFGAGDLLITGTANTLTFEGSSNGYVFDAALRPTADDAAALGVSGAAWADLFLASGSVVNFNAGDVTITHTLNSLTFAGATNGYTFSHGLQLSSNDAGALGSNGTGWSDLFLASGGVIGWDSNDVSITHSANGLAFNGASSGYTFDAVVKASADDAAALGASGTGWADLFLASGAVINFNAGDVTFTHSANTMAFAGASSGYTFDAAIKPSANDGAALGVSGTAWSDVFLATGAVINFGAGNYTITHSSGLVNFSATLDQGGGHATNGSSVGISLLAGSVRSSQTTTATATHAIYYNPNGAVGSITTNASTTSFVTSSDERLKKDFRPLKDAGEIIDNLTIHVFDWKGGGTGCGVVAQETYKVFPDAVSPGSGEPGTGDFIPWGVDYSKFAPLLIAEVQSLRKRIAHLER